MDGLIVKPKWARLIVSGKKTMEIRGHRTSKYYEPFYILESGTNMAIGIAECCGYVSVFDAEMWEHYKGCHLVTDKAFSDLPYKKVFGWQIQNAMPIEPFRYKHPHGAVIWVKDVDERKENAE